jgi:peroxin-1
VNPPQAHTVHLEPLTSSDWEIVEIHAQFLESWMINQVRAISTLHPITVYPSPTSIASLKVLKIEPEPANGPFPFAQLSPDSEVVIAPKVRKKQSSAKKKSSASSTGKKKQDRQGPSMLMRGVALPHPAYESVEEDRSHALEVYADPDSVLFPLRNADYVNVSVVQPAVLSNKSNEPSTNTANSNNNNNNNSPSPQVELSPATSVVAKLVPYSNGPEGHVGVSYGLSVALKIAGTVGNVIRLENASKPLSKVPSNILVHPYIISTAPNSMLKLAGDKTEKQAQQQKAEEEKLGKVKEWLLEGSVLSGPVSNLVQIPVLEDVLPYGGLLELEESEGWVRDASKVPLKIGSEILRGESTIPPKLEEVAKPSGPARRVVGIDKDLSEFNKAVRNSTGGTLIYGTRGSGKSAVLKEIEKGLREDLIYSVTLSCGVNADKQLQYLKETVKKLFLEASWYAPSVIIFDDIDKLIPAEVEHRDSTKSLQLAEIFKTLCQSTMASRPVSILATSQAKESVHDLLITNHLFEDVFHLKSPDKDVRETILLEALSSLGIDREESFDLLDVAGATEGYQPSDLWTLAERANHEAILKKLESDSLDSSRTVCQDDFDKAMEEFVPASLRGVKLQKSSIAWTDIGGLKETKSVLLETLEWPTKYAPIFANCPLRLRSGLLLYGYPGCGKTLLASAVAGQCGLNFISIKGPEILNKYIGASEQSVRDLFERAQAAKPCILFFDEFDSIAPKRGHDSTGVTDRVVNQMLTQMDGAEGLDGVYVLAATSRPDLIDSALLRPGRLDKSLICDMPNYEDRLDILQAVQAKMTLAPEVSMEELAEKTQGYSGADLQALLYNAYLNAIHDVVDVDMNNDESTTNDTNNSLEYFQTKVSDYTSTATANGSTLSAAERAKTTKKLEKMLLDPNQPKQPSTSSQAPSEDAAANVVIKPNHVTQSLNDTKPSISITEQRKLARIYHEFLSGRSGDMPDGSASNDIGGRATLM